MAKRKGRPEGLDQVMNNLNRQVRAIKNRTEQGMMVAGLLVQRRAQKKVPVHIGNLHASAYTRPTPENKLVIEVGFTATYALFVHENIEMKWRGLPRKSGRGVYWGPEGEAKFLENALKKSRKDIRKILAHYAEVKS